MWRRILILVLFGLSCLTTQALQYGPVPTKVRIDRTTFQAGADALQALADRVSLQVDELIPGQVASYPPDGILCFVAPSSWNRAANDPPPITLAGRTRPGEPDYSRPYSVRIALHSSVLPENQPELVYELAHELAHVKMDAHYDNYLVETFAVAVSLEVLRDLHFEPNRIADIGKYTHRLPPEIQSAIARQDWPQAAAYWQSQIPHQKSGPLGQWNFAFATLGALLLDAAQQPAWADLLGAGAVSEHCVLANGRAAGATDGAEFKMCRPAVLNMQKLGPALQALGFPDAAFRQ